MNNLKKIYFLLFNSLFLTFFLTDLQATESKFEELVNKAYHHPDSKDLKLACKLDDQYLLHFISLAVFNESFSDLPDDDFKEFVNHAAHNNVNNFAKRFKFGGNTYSPLSSLLGPFAFSRKWTEQQLRQACIVFNIYKDYESPVPEKFTSTGGSLLHTFLGKHYAEDDDPFIQAEQFYPYFKNVFETQTAESKDEEFLKYAFVFFKMTNPNNPLVGNINPIKFININDYVNLLTNKLMKDPYSQLKSCLDSSDSWRICMDFSRQRSGDYWLQYELYEEGTIPSILAGFEYLYETQKQKISRNYLETLYKKATQHQGSFNQRGMAFGLVEEETTLTFMTRCEQLYGKFAELKFEKNCHSFRSKMSMRRLSNINSTITELIDNYYKVINNDNAEFIQKVLAACELSHSLVIMHPNRDGNTRTYTTLLLNKSLMDLGLPPMAFENPNFFDGKLTEEGLPLLLKGIENFEGIFNKKLPENVLSTEELLNLADERQKRIKFLPKM